MKLINIPPNYLTNKHLKIIYSNQKFKSIYILKYTQNRMTIYCSKNSINDIFSNIINTLKTKKIKIFGIYDHEKEANNVELQLNPIKVIVFGDPKVGSLLMEEDIRVSIDLPLKISLWSENNITYAGYYKPSLLLKKYNLQKKHKILTKMDNLMKSIIINNI